MKKIMVIVEGPSDEVFWEKVLNRSFSFICRFTVINKNGRSKLIADAEKLMNATIKAGYAAIIYLVDLDDDPCITSIRELFPAKISELAKKPRTERFLHICVARKRLESWLLADELAIRAVLPKTNYTCTEPTDDVGGKSEVKKLLQAQRGVGASFREPAFAREIAPQFDPKRAVNWSASFRYFWELLTMEVNKGRP